MTISIRMKKGWKYNVENKQELYCDRCGDKLWVNPGGGIYCNGNFKACIVKKV